MKTVMPMQAQPAAKQRMRATSLSPTSVHARQLRALEHEASSVARKWTLLPARRLTWANRPFLNPLALESKGE